MIRVVIKRNKKHQICGFELSGHAGYAEEGQDIVCAAVTMLVFNTINAVEQLTKTAFTCEADEVNGGFISVNFPEMEEGREEHDTKLLLQTMVLGLKEVKKEYCRYIILNDEEV